MADLGSTLHNRPKEDLIGEEVRQHRKTKTLSGLAGLSIITLAIAALSASYFWITESQVAIENARNAQTNALVRIGTSLLSRDSPTLAALVIRELFGQPEPAGGSSLAYRLATTPISFLILRGHTRDLNYAAFSPDSQYIVTAANDATVRVWRVDGTGNPIILRIPTGAVIYAAFSPDGQQVLSVTNNGTADIRRIGWDRQASSDWRFKSFCGNGSHLAGW